MRELVKLVIAPSLGALLLGCSANRAPRIVPELSSEKPVCITLDWGGDTRATFYGRPAPDTLTLLPNPGERVSTMEWTDNWGRVELAPTQLDRRGGGWVWWTMADTLVIQVENPTMDGIAIWLVDNDERSVATWKEFGLRASDNSPAGRVRLRPYECSGPAKDELSLVGVSKGADSGHLGDVGEVIRDSSRWQGAWGLIAPPPAPYVDFKREMLVLAAGPTGAPGDSVVIERVTESAKGLEIRVIAYQQCSPLMMVKRPYHVVRIRRSDRKPVFESLRVRGPHCIPADPAELKITRSPATGIVPAVAPDTVASWVRADSLIGPSAYVPVRFRHNILVVHFRREATQTQRQAAIDMISGTVVGGAGGRTGNGFYLIRVADPGDGSGLVRAAEALKGLASVTSAGPDIEFGPN